MTGVNQVTDEDRLDPAELGLGAAHRRQLADFVEAVHDRPRRRGSGTAEARTALSVILAMYESAASGRPVKL